MSESLSRSHPRGRAGEDYAAALLEREGMRVVARNFHSRYGEVDIIAQDGGDICFVEVKTRKAGSMVSGEEAVSLTKQRKLIQTALCWIQEQNCGLQPRFDVCVVTTERGIPVSHQYYAAAFDGGAYGD